MQHERVVLHECQQFNSLITPSCLRLTKPLNIVTSKGVRLGKRLWGITNGICELAFKNSQGLLTL